MTPRAGCDLRRGVRWGWQEFNGLPMDGFCPAALVPLKLKAIAWVGFFAALAPQSNRQTTTAGKAVASTFFFFHAAANCPSPKIAMQIAQSYMAHGAKQDEFCTGPRQGN